MLNEQFSVVEMAHKLEVSAATVYRALRVNGIAPADHDSVYHKPELSDILTKDVLDAHLNKEGLTAAEVAAACSVSVQTIYAYVERCDVELPTRAPRTTQPSGLNSETIRQLYVADGLSVRQVADKIGTSHKALRDFMTTNRIARRSRSVRLDDEAVSHGYLAGETMQDLATRFGCSVWSISQALERTETPKRPGGRQ